MPSILIFQHSDLADAHHRMTEIFCNFPSAGYNARFFNGHEAIFTNCITFKEW
jgi:hypothetical protein